MTPEPLALGQWMAQCAGTCQNRHPDSSATTAMTPKLSQLAELLRQLAVRNFYKKTREFLISRGIAVGSGWAGVQTAIVAQEPAAGFDDFLVAFETFVRDAVLVSH